MGTASCTWVESGLCHLFFCVDCDTLQIKQKIGGNNCSAKIGHQQLGQLNKYIESCLQGMELQLCQRLSTLIVSQHINQLTVPVYVAQLAVQYLIYWHTGPFELVWYHANIQYNCCLLFSVQVTNLKCRMDDWCKHIKKTVFLVKDEVPDAVVQFLHHDYTSNDQLFT